MYQRIELIGNLGNPPEMRYTPNGTAVCNISVATSEKYTKKDGEKVNDTTWFRVSIWGSQAEACNTYLKKGSKVFVAGRMAVDKATGGPRTYESGGTWKASFEVTAKEVKFLDSRSEPSAPKEPSQSAQDTFHPDDDIPF